MGWISNWINEEDQAREAALTIDETLTDLMVREELETPFIPKKMYSDRNFVNYVINKVAPVASVIAYGSELPNETFGDFRKNSGKLFKAGLSYMYDEELQWDMRDAIRLAADRRISVQNVVQTGGRVIPGSNNSLADLIFGSIETMTIGLHDLLRLHTYQPIQFGFANYTDPRTGASHKLDYRDPTADWGFAPYGNFAHFPPDLAGAERWTQYATANPLQRIRDDVEVYEDTTGRKPDAIMMSKKARQHMMLCESTRQAFAAVINTSAGIVVNNVGLVDPVMINTLMDRLELPQILVNDEKYKTRNPLTKKLINQRFFNEDRYSFLCHNMGEQAFGPVMENNGEGAGPYIVAREIKNFPPEDALQGVATMLPVFPDPKLLFSRKVFDL